MYNNEQTLELLRKLGELRSENYEIDWDEWEHFDNDTMEYMVSSGVEEYETKFSEIADKISELDVYEENTAKELEEVIDGLIMGYVYQTLLRKKKAIEDFISTT